MLKLKELDAPSVVRVYDYAAQPGHGAAVVMELVNGVSLSTMIERQGPLDPEAALTVLKGTLLGLAAVHRLGFGHRDVKPGNVLVDNAGQVKLTNFGLAAPAAGTPAYLAPERWEGDPGSQASELYAATAVFFECLTGAPPFSGDLARLREQHESGALPLDRVDAPLAPLIEQGMAKDWASRPHSANAFVSELEALASSAYGPDWEERGTRSARGPRRGPAAAVARRPSESPGRFSGGAGGSDRRRRLVVIASIAAAAVIVLGAIVTGVTLSGGEHRASLSGSVSRDAGPTGLLRSGQRDAPGGGVHLRHAERFHLQRDDLGRRTGNGELPVGVLLGQTRSGASRELHRGRQPRRDRRDRQGQAGRPRLGRAQAAEPSPEDLRQGHLPAAVRSQPGGITARATVQPATRTASCVRHRRPSPRTARSPPSRRRRSAITGPSPTARTRPPRP